MLGDAQMRKLLKRLAGIGVKWKYPNDDFTFRLNCISENILVFRKREKNKPKQLENLSLFRFRVICIIWGKGVSFREAADRATTFIKINVPPQLFLCSMIVQMIPSCKTHHVFFAFSGTFIIRFSGNDFSQGYIGHCSVKCHVWEKVCCWVVDQKSIDQLDCMKIAWFFRV